MDTLKTVYLDHAATTPLDNEVLEAMHEVEKEIFGNPSSLYRLGREAKTLLESDRHQVAQLLGASPSEIIFTGSGTESDNLAIFGIATAYAVKGKHIIVSSIEHKAVLSSAKALEQEGWSVTYLPVDNNGFVNPEDVAAALTSETTLISIMYANNEIGTVEPIREIAKTIEVSPYSPLFHTDACQATGLLPIKPSELGVDLMTLNSSKIYGPKGVGLLWLKDGVKLEPMIVGGDQEHGLRAGTENISLIHGFVTALTKALDMEHREQERLTELRNYFIAGVQKAKPEVLLNGDTKKRLANNINLTIPHLEGESLVMSLDQHRICCSTGSACTALDLAPSHVLKAIGISDELVHGSLRFTLGRETTKSEIDYTLSKLTEVIDHLMTITITPNMLNKDYEYIS